MKGNLIIISSPSGGGKGTLIREILRSVPDIGYSISLTTRPPRPGEKDGEEYHFVSRAEFEKFAAENGFLEHAEVHGNLYGTSKRQTDAILASGRDVILEIDVQGANLVLAKMPDAVSIFILPPSFEALRDRLTGRATEDPMNLSTRLRNAFVEVTAFSQFRYFVVNDEIGSASQKLEMIILAERQRTNRQAVVIQSILDSFDRAKKIENTGD
ncbi:MAG: guanylate kinase [Acidobacteria bacterium]|nr:guanylate kinase [Acidobacteriota bacterium]MCA1609061.1 guanylate kinase [Acidobacteriota bacterium]